jgi:hypothetical protein
MPARPTVPVMTTSSGAGTGHRPGAQPQPFSHPAPAFWPHAWLPARQSASVDPSAPHLARVYSYWLGGKDNSPADRKVAEEVLNHRPQVAAGARVNREFLIRVVEYLATSGGVSQFLDIGAGLPAPGATHEVAQAINPRSRIVYVDRDPLVLARARARLTGGAAQGAVACAEADMRNPAAVLAQAASTLDFSRPVAVLLLAVLHFLPGSNGPAGIVATLASGLAPGSFIAISHATADFAPRQVTAAVEAYNTLMPTPVTARTHREITGLFGGLRLVAPGVVPISGWRPRPHDAMPVPADLYAGLASTRRVRRR